MRELVYVGLADGWVRGGCYEVVAPAGDVIEFTGSNVSARRATADGIGTAHICVVSCQGRVQHGIGIANEAHLLFTQERDLDGLVRR